MTPTIQTITIRHLLTMTAPYRYDTEPYEEFFTSLNPIVTALDYLGGAEPTGSFAIPPSGERTSSPAYSRGRRGKAR